MMTKIIKCEKCVSHQFQDKEYGEKHRVCNMLKKSEKSGIQKFRCTICTTVHETN